MIAAAEDLDLTPKQLTDLTWIALGQNRRLNRVADFMRDLAAVGRTDEERDLAFQQSTPEQRNRVIDEGDELMKAVRSFEDNWGETISLNIITRLSQFGSPSEIIRQMEEIDGISLENTRYAHHNGNAVHSVILRDFAESLEQEPGRAFDINSFLDCVRETYLLRDDRERE
jgi:hypothetical protein